LLETKREKMSRPHDLIYSQHLANVNSPDAVAYVPEWFEKLGPDLDDEARVHPLDRYNMFIKGYLEADFTAHNSANSLSVLSPLRVRATSERLMIGAAFTLALLLMAGY